MGLFSWLTGDDADETPEAAPVPPAPTKRDIEQALTRIESQVAEARLATPVVSRCRTIISRLRQTLPRVSQGLGSADEYALVAMATSYLPEALNAYLRLPRDWADTRPIEGHKTSLLVLIDQLDLLSATVDRIYDAILAHDAEALVAHGRFLRERLSVNPGISLDQPISQAPLPAPPTGPTATPAKQRPSANPLDLEGL